MDKASTIIAIASGIVAVVAGVAAGLGFVARLWIAPLNLQIANLQAQIQGLGQAINRETEEIKKAAAHQDERHRRHTGDTDRHISAEWRHALDRRLERIEGYLIEIVRPK